MPHIEEPQQHLFLDTPSATGGLSVLHGHDKRWAQTILTRHHYLHGVPSAKCYYMKYDDALIVYAIPANPQLAQFLLGTAGSVWELARLWAPDGHARNLLTQAIAASARRLRQLEPLDCLVAYADPAVGHVGYVYRAASWLYTGQSEETRSYHSPDGQVVARRAFHSSTQHLNKADILALGFTETRTAGKHRYIRPLSRRAKRACGRLA